ncbi:MAG: rRNA maturation RNase YbeY [Saprospiraceae bacterium]|nr:rRNA maturation RNase YbeY [Saprospiraceae bacterium]
MDLDDVGVISFYAENVAHPFAKSEKNYINWLEKVVREENKSIASLCFVFCSDDQLLDINLKYLQHDYYTDIITFPYKEGLVIEGDMYISLDRVKENALEFGVSFENELRRVMVHGVLHLMGYGDKTKDEISIIRSKEDYYIDAFV